MEASRHHHGVGKAAACMLSVAATAFLLAASLPIAAQTQTPSPFSGTPISVPATFEAENFDRGGEGVAYHDNVKGNAGGQYRTSEDVDIIVSTDSAGGGYVVHNFETGEWLAYTVNVASSAQYDIALRVTSGLSNSAFHIEIDGVNVTGSVLVPNTGGWSNFQWVGKQGVPLTTGVHVLKIIADQQYFDLNSIRVLSSPTPTPYSGVPIAIPGTFEAENFDRGGEGIGYHDNVPGNAGGQYRPNEDVDIIASTDPEGGGYVVHNFETGEWLAYTVNVASSAQYDIALRVTSGFPDSAFHIEIDGVNVTGRVFVPNTGGWSNFQWVGKQGVPLTAGRHVLKIVVDQQYFDLNSIRIIATPPIFFEAENFDSGGEGIGYHDNVPGNAGGQYRTGENVDIIVSSDSAGGGYVVNNFETGEWLAYTVNVPSSAQYDIALRVTSGVSNSAFHIEIDGVNVTGSVLVPNTGGWSNFQWVGKQGVPLTAGRHVLKVVADQQYFDLNSIRIIATPPIFFEAENFDSGGEGIGYHDNVPGNAGGQYRPNEDVDIIASTDPEGGGYVVHNFETGEWLAYTVNVASSAQYDIALRVTSGFPNSAFHIEIDDVNVTGRVFVPNTGGWSNFQWVGKQGVPLTAGRRVLKIVADQQYFDLNSVRIIATPTRIEDTSPDVSYTPLGPTWVHGTHALATFGTFAETQTAGASAILSFTGTGVRWLGARNSNNGKARVLLDGVFMGEVDTYGPSLEAAVLFTATGFPRGAHTLTIEVTGTKNQASTDPDTWVIIDAFDITP